MKTKNHKLWGGILTPYLIKFVTWSCLLPTHALIPVFIWLILPLLPIPIVPITLTFCFFLSFFLSFYIHRLSLWFWIWNNFWAKSRHKIAAFHLNFWCGNFVERDSFLKISGDSAKTQQKLCLFTKFPRHIISWNVDILSNESK